MEHRNTFSHLRRKRFAQQASPLINRSQAPNDAQQHKEDEDLITFGDSQNLAALNQTNPTMKQIAISRRKDKHILAMQQRYDDGAKLVKFSFGFQGISLIIIGLLSLGYWLMFQDYKALTRELIQAKDDRGKW